MINDRELFGPYPPKPYRNAALLEIANGAKCVRCGHAEPGSVVACHYHGPFSYLLGKASAQKAGDIYTAELCWKCHDLFDAAHLVHGGWTTEAERGLELAICIMRTWQVRIARGQLTLVVNKRKAAVL